MSMFSKFWRGSAKKIIREWYTKERQDIEYRLFGEVETGMDEFKKQLTDSVCERMIRDGVDSAIVGKLINEVCDAWDVYVPSRDKITKKIMKAIDRYMSRKFGYEIPGERNPI